VLGSPVIISQILVAPAQADEDPMSPTTLTALLALREVQSASLALGAQQYWARDIADGSLVQIVAVPV